MKNITNKNQNFAMSPSYSITEANLLDIFANLLRMIISSEYATSYSRPDKGTSRTPIVPKIRI